MTENEVKNDKKIKKGIKIRSIQANSIYQVNKNNTLKPPKEDIWLDCGKTVISNSLFSEFLRKYITINKRNFTKDIINMKFDYGVKVRSDIGIDKVIPADKLREMYYSNNATICLQDFLSKEQKKKQYIEGDITYQMLYRSTGKAKEGDCIFIKQDIHDTVLDYLTMGLYKKMLKLQPENPLIVELSAYCSLVTATAIDYIDIPLENIFVVKDRESVVNKKAVVVKTDDKEHYRNALDKDALEGLLNQQGFTLYKKKVKTTGYKYICSASLSAIEAAGAKVEALPKKQVAYKKKECHVVRGNKCEVKNTLWDGMGLIDESIFPEKMNGFIYCRSHFFKSCLFRGNIQDYFRDTLEDYETAVLEDMFGRKLKVTDIKVIITENSLKWMKFINLMCDMDDVGDSKKRAFEYYEKWMKKYGERFSIVKTGHESKWGKLQKSSYQINNSLPTTDKDILRKIAQESIEYCNRLKNSDDFFIDHLARTEASYTIAPIMVALDKHTQGDLRKTEFFLDKKRRMISRFKRERLMRGKLLQQGDNLTICGNPIALLKEAVNAGEKLSDPCFKKITKGIQCYTARFADKEKLAGFRSPHNSPNNIGYMENVYAPLLLKCFPNLGENVIVVNCIETDIQYRFNGMDEDSDCAYVTNQTEIVSLAKMACVQFPTIVNGIKPDGNNTYSLDMESYAAMDNKISSAQSAIGESSNLAQLALSYYYDGGGVNKDLEDVFIICSVLAQCAIDSAKRTFEVDLGSEINRIRQLPCMNNRTVKYPRFYAEEQKDKLRHAKRTVTKEEFEKLEEQTGRMNCPMDILAEIIDSGVDDLRSGKVSVKDKRQKIDLDSLWNFTKNDVMDSKKKNGIENIIDDYYKETKKLDSKSDDYDKRMAQLLDEYLAKLTDKYINKDMMQALLYGSFGDSAFHEKVLIILYNYNKDVFLSCFAKELQKQRMFGSKKKMRKKSSK